MKNDLAFGNLIKRRRESLGIEKQAFAEKAKVSLRTLYDIEGGNQEKRERRPETVASIMRALGLPLSVLDALERASAKEALSLVDVILADAETGSLAALTPKTMTMSVDVFAMTFKISKTSAERIQETLATSSGILITP